MSINDTILQQLENGNANNAEVVLNDLSKWDKSEYEFPVIELVRYIRMHEWKYTDFTFDMENVLLKVLPKFVHDIFFDMKEFRSNSRNELTSTGETFARMNAWPRNTQDEKAYCQYRYSYNKYYNNSIIHRDEGE